MPDPAGTSRWEDLSSALAGDAHSLYEDTRLVPMLRRLMTVSCGFTGAIGSSISMIDPVAGRYTKVAEQGTACQLGHSFPLDEGVTGRVMAGRRPIVLASYRHVTAGHLPPGSPAGEGAVAAIPIWWRGDVIGVNVVFAGCPRSFRTDEVDRLEVVTQLVAPGIVTAAGRDLSMTHLLRRTEGPDTCRRLGTGTPDPARASVAEVALGLASLLERAPLQVPGATGQAQVRVIHGEDGVRLDVRDPGDGPTGWQELVDAADGAVGLAPAGEPGGESLQPAGSGEPGAGSSPFTAREQQVAALLSQGMSDRAIAHALLIAPKTAEKHVGAVLRKTGATSRTAAVVRALERGWLAEGLAVRP